MIGSLSVTDSEGFISWLEYFGAEKLVAALDVLIGNFAEGDLKYGIYQSPASNNNTYLYPTAILPLRHNKWQKGHTRHHDNHSRISGQENPTGFAVCQHTA